jgi:cytoskeletal protein CcmA (bactofilin family)
MWKWKEEERPAAPSTPPQPPRAVAEVPTHLSGPSAAPKEVRPVETHRSNETFRADVAHIGKSVIIKGELSGSEDLYLDGEVEGSIELNHHNLVIGPNGRVRANVRARDVVIHGKVDGNVYGVERVELKKSGILSGDISTQRIVIEDGAFFKGGIDIRKESPKDALKETAKELVKDKEAKAEPKPEAAEASAKVSGSLPLPLNTRN